MDLENKATTNSNEPQSSWYAIRTYAGKEKSVRDGILRIIQENHLENDILRVVLPTEDVIVASKNKKTKTQIVEKPLYSGYVFIQMVFTNELWVEIRNLPSISNFVGGSQGPTALSQKEISKILDKIENRKPPRPLHDFNKNESVRIIEGNFAGFEGTVDEYDIERGILKLNLEMLGRNTPLEIEYTQVEKIDE